MGTRLGQAAGKHAQRKAPAQEQGGVEEEGMEAEAKEEGGGTQQGGGEGEGQENMGVASKGGSGAGKGKAAGKVGMPPPRKRIRASQPQHQAEMMTVQ